MFYKEAKHGGATRSTLQPEENWSLLTGLSIREEHMSTAPPSGSFTSSAHLLADVQEPRDNTLYISSLGN